jgi:EpsI family protein
VGAVAGVLVAQTAVTHQIATVSAMPAPNRPPLADIPLSFGDWGDAQEVPVPEQAVDMLAPDDMVSRVYRDRATGVPVELFITYYKSQFSDKNAHSPKVCLPGSGWAPVESKTIDIPVPGAAAPLSVNHYVIARGDSKALVLYWHQTHKDVVAGEYTLKLHRIINALRYHRTDMLFARMVTPLTDRQQAEDRAVRFAQQVYPMMLQQF